MEGPEGILLLFPFRNFLRVVGMNESERLFREGGERVGGGDVTTG